MNNYGAMVTHLLVCAVSQVAETDLRSSNQYCSRTKSLGLAFNVQVWL